MPPRKPTKNRDINYLSKDFDSIKLDLLNYLKKYFPNSIQDFNDASGGMAIIDLMAYISDVLNFQMDRSVNESFVSRAVERKNIIALADMYGYKTKTVVPATAYMTLSATFQNTISADTIFTLKKGSRVTSSVEPANFELIDDADFSNEENRSFIENDGVYTTYALSGVRAVAGRTKTFKYQVGNQPRPFLSVTLPDRSISEITSVISSDGTEFYEVDNLATDVVMIGDSNVSDNSDNAENILKIKKVPNRFVMEREPDGTLSLRFGSGDSTVEDSELIPNPDDFVLPPKLRGSVSGFTPESVDSTNFLSTKSLGNRPAPNSIITVQYRVGGGVDTNVGADVLTNFVEKRVSFNNSTATDTYPNETKVIQDSIRINNTMAAFGGEEAETNASIRQNAINSINSQNRCITLADYKIRAMSMPSEFGKPFRVIAKKDPYKNSGIALYLVSRNNEGKLQETSGLLKNNLETYLKPFKGVTDSIRIDDGNILNFGVNFSIFPSAGFNQQQSLVKAIYVINNFFDIRKMDFGISISLSDLLRNIQNLDEVAAVPYMKIVNLTGTVDGREYSSYSENIDSITKNNIMYFKPNVIPELRYMNFDIQGSIA